MDARMLGVIGAAAARFEIGFVAVERFADADRAAFIIGSAGLPPCECPRLIDRLPIRKDVWRGRGFKIIGEGDFLDPLGTAVGYAHAPRACPGVAPVAEMDAGADPGPIGLFLHRDLAAGGGAFDLFGAPPRARAKPSGVS